MIENNKCIQVLPKCHADDPTATLAAVERKVVAVAWRAEEVHVPCRPSTLGTSSPPRNSF
jgi:hypothetical protein